MRNNQGQKALFLTKSLIRSIKASKNLIDMFDDFNFRSLAIDLEYFV